MCAPPILHIVCVALFNTRFARAVGAGGFIVVWAYQKLKHSDEEEDFNISTRQKEVKKNWVSIGINGSDPFVDLANWYLIIRFCRYYIWAIYLVIIVMGIFAAGITVRTNIMQLRTLNQCDEINLGDEEMDREFKALKKKHDDVKMEGEETDKMEGERMSIRSVMVAGEGGEEGGGEGGVKKEDSRLVSAVLPGVVKKAGTLTDSFHAVRKSLRRNKVKPVIMATKTMRTGAIEDEEKLLLAKFLLLRKYARVKFEKRRKEERVVAAMTQILVEDIPLTICNMLYMVWGCQKEREEEPEDGCKQVGKAEDKFAVAFFLGTTVFATFFAAKKYVRSERSGRGSGQIGDKRALP